LCGASPSDVPTTLIKVRRFTSPISIFAYCGVAVDHRARHAFAAGNAASIFTAANVFR
jgi:hypothetical protein